MAREAGSSALAPCYQRIAVSAAIAALHVMIIYVLASSLLHSYGRLTDAVIEADVIPNDLSVPKPPSLPPLIVRDSSPVDFAPLRVDMDVPTEQVVATQAIDIRLPDTTPRLPDAAPYEVDPFPLVLPRPISGPRGADRYPNESIKAKESGTVVINICVSQAGRVDSVEIARSSGFPRLDKVAVGIASEYRFQPATRRGHPVAACAEYSIAFKVT